MIKFEKYILKQIQRTLWYYGRSGRNGTPQNPSDIAVPVRNLEYKLSGLSKKSDLTISASSHNLNVISIESKTPHVAALVDKTDLFSKVIKEKIPNSWGLLSKTNLSSGTNGVKDFSRTKLTWNKKGHYAKEYKL